MSPNRFPTFITPTPVSKQSSFLSSSFNSCSLSNQTPPIYFAYNGTSKASHVHFITTSTASSSSSSSSPTPVPNELKVGQIVAIQRSKQQTRPDIGKIVGSSSSGETVDIQPLEEFVKELYVESKKGEATFEKAIDIYPIQCEYVPNQNGWIVLDIDLVPAKDYFEQRFSSIVITETSTTKTSVAVTEDKKELSEQDLKRQFFKPTKNQAFLASALSLPISALFYSAYSTVRDVYQSNPQGSDLLNATFFRTVLLFVTLGSSILSLVAGSALLLYAMSSKEDQGDN